MSLIPIGLIVGDKYRVLQKIGSGTNSVVYSAVDVSNPNEQVVLKFERMEVEYPHLFHERSTFKRLEELGGGGGDGWRLPQYKDYFQDFERGYNILVLELLGPSLEHCFQACSRTFSLKTVLLIATQMLESIQSLHNMGFLHQDIKPDNFVIGLGENSKKVYLIDLGLSKEYSNVTSHHSNHLRYRAGLNLVGSALFASINNHRGVERSRRDDLEAVGYTLLYFLRGSLPWQGIGGNGKQQVYENIREAKQTISVEQLCDGFPQEFATYLNYCKGLGFEDKPNYRYLKRVLFWKLFLKLEFHFDKKKLDWVELEEKKTKEEEKPKQSLCTNQYYSDSS